MSEIIDKLTKRLLRLRAQTDKTRKQLLSELEIYAIENSQFSTDEMIEIVSGNSVKDGIVLHYKTSVLIGNEDYEKTNLKDNEKIKSDMRRIVYRVAAVKKNGEPSFQLRYPFMHLLTMQNNKGGYRLRKKK